MTLETIPPCSGTAFALRRGQTLRVVDPHGEQVADLIAFTSRVPRASLSAGKSIDFANTLRLTTGHILYSNTSTPMLEIRGDSVGVHDIVLAPCSQETFDLLYTDVIGQHPNCFGNLAAALARFGIVPEAISSTFNIFMNVRFDVDGSMSIGPPASKPGDEVRFAALDDLVIGLTACSAEKTNNHHCTEMRYAIEG